jgi:sortase B
MKNYNKHKQNLFLNILIAISFLGVLISLYFVVSEERIYSFANNNYQEIRDYRNVEEKNSQESIALIDFDSLEEINPDVVGWIGYEGLEIDYPLVQGEDNEYYLNHLFTLERNKLGAIFLDYRNQSDFSDRNTIVYGHNMKDGSMFSSLTKYKDNAYYIDNPDLLLITKEHTYRIEFFAGLVIDGSYESVYYDFNDDEDFTQYIDSLVQNSTFKSSVNVGVGDRIISLVTCSYEFNNARYALYGKLVELP